MHLWPASGVSYAFVKNSGVFMMVFFVFKGLKPTGSKKRFSRLTSQLNCPISLHLVAPA